MESATVVLEVDETPAVSAVDRANKSLQMWEDMAAKASAAASSSVSQSGAVQVNVTEKTTAAVKRHIESLERQAALYGKSGVEKLIALSERSVAAYGKEESARNAILAQYKTQIDKQRQLDAEAAKNQGIQERTRMLEAAVRASEKAAAGELQFQRALSQTNRAASDAAKRQADQIAALERRAALSGASGVGRLQVERQQFFAGAGNLAPDQIQRVNGAYQQLMATEQQKIESARKHAEAQKQVNSSLADTAVQAAAVYLSYRALTAAAKATMLDPAMYAARTETLGVALGAAGRANEISPMVIREQEKAVKALGITTQDTRVNLLRMITAQMDLAKATQLARMAQDVAIVSGENSSETFTRLVRAIQSGEVEMLRNIGVNATFESAYTKAAKAVGKTTQDLSEHEKMLIRLNVVLQQAPRYQGMYEEGMRTTGKQITSLSRYFDEAKNAIGERFAPALQFGVSTLTKAAQFVGQHAGAFASLTAAVLGTASALGVFAASAKVINMLSDGVGGLASKLSAFSGSVGALGGFATLLGAGAIAVTIANLNDLSDSYDRFFKRTLEGGQDFAKRMKSALDSIREGKPDTGGLGTAINEAILEGNRAGYREPWRDPMANGRFGQSAFSNPDFAEYVKNRLKLDPAQIESLTKMGGQLGQQIMGALQESFEKNGAFKDLVQIKVIGPPKPLTDEEKLKIVEQAKRNAATIRELTKQTEQYEARAEENQSPQERLRRSLTDIEARRKDYLADHPEIAGQARELFDRQSWAAYAKYIEDVKTQVDGLALSLEDLTEKMSRNPIAAKDLNTTFLGPGGMTADQTRQVFNNLPTPAVLAGYVTPEKELKIMQDRERHEARMIELTAGPGGEMGAVQRVYEMRLRYAAEEQAAQERLLRSRESGAKLEEDLLAAKDAYNQKVSDAAYEREEKIYEVQRRHFEDVKRSFEGVFDAFLERTGNAAQAAKNLFLSIFVTPIKEALANMVSSWITPMLYGGPRQQGASGGGGILAGLGGMFGGFGAPSATMGGSWGGSGGGMFGSGWGGGMGNPYVFSAVGAPAAFGSTALGGVSSGVNIPIMGPGGAVIGSIPMGAPAGGGSRGGGILSNLASFGNLKQFLGFGNGGWAPGPNGTWIQNGPNAFFRSNAAAMIGGLLAFDGFRRNGSAAGSAEMAGGGAMLGYKFGGLGGALIGGGAGLMISGWQRGGVSGLAQSTAGGAIAGFGVAGPIGAVVGAGVGFIGGLFRLGAKSPTERMREKVQGKYGVNIQDKGVLQQLVDLAKQTYGGNFDLCIQSTQVQELVQLYADMTGQKMTGSKPAMTPLALVEVGGQLYQQPNYRNGTPYAFPSSLPTFGSSSLGGTRATGMSSGPGVVYVQLDRQATTEVLDGRVAKGIAAPANARPIQAASLQATRGSFGRRESAARTLNPAVLVG